MFSLPARPSIVLFCFALAVLFSAEAALVRISEEWSYLKTASEAAMPDPRWTEPGFDDSQWSKARSSMEFPEEQPVTLLSQRPQKIEQVFARKRFFVSDRSAIQWLVLQIEHENGFAAYLNGVEVGRHRGAGFEKFAAEDEIEHLARPVTLDISRFRHLLVEGENVLALQGTDSGQILSAFPLAAELRANFAREPFVQNASTMGMQVIWRTPVPAYTFFEYGTTTNLGTILTNATPAIDHVITLTGLSPNTPYYYRAGARTGTSVVRSELASFRTLKTEGPVHFVFIGDTGQNTPAQADMAKVVRDLNPEIVLHGGDIIYGGFTDATADTRFFSYYQPQIRSTPWFLSVGNHDLNCCGGRPDDNMSSWQTAATNFQHAFYLPTNSVSGTEHFYSFDHGDVHFVALFNPWFAIYVPTAEGDQFRWLTNDLAASRKPWKILFFHMPVANSGAHSTRDFNGNGILDQVEMMQLLLPVARQYGVQLILNGHEHNFERFAPTNGLHYAVSGGGGVGLYALSSTPHPASAQFWAVHHCLEVRVAGDTLTVDAVGLDGRAFDGFTVHKAWPERKVYEATWHSPVIESGPANDGDANITGQRFDFEGAPILPRAGDTSNLGRIFVNNDATNLYVGFDQAMYYLDHNLFLFVENPRAPGVTSMAGLGNGIIDPAGEGADGLDCLENLSFTNFAPNIACLLGDETGDGQYRSLTRPTLALNIGQGMFRLDKKLSDVPGTRLQQFNRSPQRDRVVYEQSADFIELAMPLSALGDAKPGDVIKLGAVVGTGRFDAASQTRELDTGVLGHALIRLGPQTVSLEGIAVRLAHDPSRPPSIAIEALGGRQFRLSWNASVGALYEVEAADVLPNFRPLNQGGWPRVATSSQESLVIDAAETTRFYRIRVVR